MSALSRFFSGFGFRTTVPSYDPGDELTVVLTGFREEDETGLVRIGDTVIEIPEGASPDLVERLVEIRIASFDPVEHRGKAELLSEGRGVGSA